MRLAFAAAVHSEPEILLIDEVLSVGDEAFQRKCMERIAQFRRSGCTIVFVSHDADAVIEMCDQALWLHGGRVMAGGRASDVVDAYLLQSGSAEPSAVST